jgi:kojibiose phosphorylase
VSELTIPAEGNLVIEKRTAVTSSFDRDTSLTPAAILTEADGLSYPELFAEHARQWQQRWQAADVVLSGDDTSQLALRASLYHLLRAHPDDGRLAIDPKGYAGDAYRGCYFWDTEMYLLPFFLYTDLERARQLVEYRIHSLPGARANAAATGYRGARYAWEADVDGTETCPNWQYRDHEVHVTADVVYGLAYYGRAANDKNFLIGPAAPVLLEAARYWLDRLDWRKGDAYPSLLGVMGPDEYTPISNNNSFTNRMAAFVLALAARLGEQIGATPEERRQFAAAAAGLPILRSADGRLVRQCEDFEHLAEPAFERFWRDRTRPYAAQVAQEWLYRSKCLKQADVLMLMMLFADEFSDEEVAAAWDYYLPYTTHDSSLSAGVHAIVACRLGKLDEAWAFWQRSSLNDLDVAHGGAAEGVHIAGAGINWQVAVFGFAGLSSVMNRDRLTLRPRLPRAWSRLAFPLLWQGAPLYVEITPGEVRVANRSRSALEVEVNGQLKRVAAGEGAVWISGETG